MPDQYKDTEKRILEACASIRGQERPNISAVARQFDVPMHRLRSRINGRPSRSTRQQPTQALTKAQERAVIQWVRYLDRLHLSPTASMVTDCANTILKRNAETDPPPTVGKNWVYGFITRLPTDLLYVKQKPMDKDRILAEQLSDMVDWFDHLKILLQNIGPSNIYNFDETGTHLGQTKPQKVITTNRERAKHIAGGGHAESISAIEFIAANGDSFPPFFIPKGERYLEQWFEYLPDDYVMEISPQGYVTDEIAYHWLDHFDLHTKTRVQRGQNRLLLMDGHGSHTTKEFLTKCEERGIIPFPFLPHSTHLVQPLDDKPFLAYKQKYKALNNSILRFGGDASDKRDFFRDVASTRGQAFTPGTIRSGFRNCGIWPFNPKVVLKKLEAKQPQYPDLQVFGDNTGWLDSTTPPPISSPLDAPTTPRTVQRSTDKLKKRLTTTETPIPEDLQRMVERLAERSRTASNLVEALQHDLALATAIKERREKPKSKRQLSDSGVLSSRDAKRSIQARRDREKATADRRADRFAKKMQKMLPKEQAKRDIWVLPNGEIAGGSNDATFVNSFISDFE